MMSDKLYVYATKINYILIINFKIYVDVKGKGYYIYQNNDGIWLESDDDSVLCRLKHFDTDDKMLLVITEEECKLDDWVQWKKEKG
jgi:hypothetical protein